MFRISIKCYLTWIICLSVFVIIWNIVADSQDEQNNYLYTCNMTKEYMNELEKLLEK